MPKCDCLTTRVVYTYHSYTSHFYDLGDPEKTVQDVPSTPTTGHRTPKPGVLKIIDVAESFTATRPFVINVGVVRPCTRALLPVSDLEPFP